MGAGRGKKVKGRRGLMTAPTIPEENTESDESFEKIPDLEKNCLNAKMQLLTQHTDDGVSLYDHLSRLIAGLLDDRPESVGDDLENMSKTLKRERLHAQQNTLRPSTSWSSQGRVAKAEWRLFNANYEKPATEADHDVSDADDRWNVMPNLLRQSYVFQMAGVGLPTEEYMRLIVAIKDLIRHSDSCPVESIRFWGKILGRSSNYYVIEAEFPEGDYESDISLDEVSESMDTDTRSDMDKTESEFDDLSSTIKPEYKPPPKVPCEAAGVGLNKKVYFVCNELCQPWVRLPHVTPAQIIIARKIRKFFTGNLDSKMVTFPPFPGLEKHYLRAQIARISASTLISPIGYLKFDEDVEDEDEEEDKELDNTAGRDSFIEDSDYEGLLMRDLTRVSHWVHHAPFILPQGRVTWYNVASPREAEPDEDEEDEEEERKEPDEPVPETGPPLLTPISEDQNVGFDPAWITKASSQFIPEYSLALIQSNIWPGAVTVATDQGRFFENVYIGWGVKNLEHNFEPTLPDPPVQEFPTGPEVIEADDPTPETEAAVRAALLREKEIEAVAEEEGVEGEEGEEGGEEEEDLEEDD